MAFDKLVTQTEVLRGLQSAVQLRIDRGAAGPQLTELNAKLAEVEEQYNSGRAEVCEHQKVYFQMQQIMRSGEAEEGWEELEAQHRRLLGGHDMGESYLTTIYFQEWNKTFQERDLTEDLCKGPITGGD